VVPENERAFVHETALCESIHVGAGSRVWAFAHVLPGARVGKNCNICDGVFIENDVTVGDDVTIKCGVQLWDGLRVGDRVFIGPNATFTNDRMPRSKVRPDKFLQTVLEDDVSIGANATILPGLTIGRGAVIGAGAVVTRSVPPFAKAVGNPAKIVGYQTNEGDLDSPSSPGAASTHGLGTEAGSRLDLGIGDCFLERLPHFADMRGSLTPLEADRGLPFTPARVFLVYGVESGHVRGAHAHRTCAQFLVAAHGSVSVVVDDGSQRVEVRLVDQTMGLYLPPMIWGIQFKYAPDSVLMVLASHLYQADDYLRDYDEFCRLVARPE
jgi:UDP-2-acetamido-3-amino-2,3-dideoxy-glucuronate N-acetyltransferase